MKYYEEARMEAESFTRTYEPPKNPIREGRIVFAIIAVVALFEFCQLAMEQGNLFLARVLFWRRSCLCAWFGYGRSFGMTARIFPMKRIYMYLRIRNFFRIWCGIFIRRRSLGGHFAGTCGAQRTYRECTGEVLSGLWNLVLPHERGAVGTADAGCHAFGDA